MASDKASFHDEFDEHEAILAGQGRKQRLSCGKLALRAVKVFCVLTMLVVLVPIIARKVGPGGFGGNRVIFGRGDHERLGRNRTSLGRNRTNAPGQHNNTVGFYLRAPCVPCDPTVGRYLDGADFANVSDQEISAGETCDEGFACESGCCQRCLSGKMCLAATVSVTGNYGDNVCPAGYTCDGESKPALCPEGFYCEAGDIITNCTEVVAASQEASGQSVYDGMYCPEGSSSLVDCPEGYYCYPDGPAYLCPEGYYCAEKTLSPIQCAYLKDCPEGTVEEPLSFYLQVLMPVALCMFLLSTFLEKKAEMKDKREKRSVTPSARASSPAAVRIDFKNVTLQLKGGQEAVVVNQLSGRMEAGTMTALMGSSGAGKTSFLNALCGRAGSYGRVSGEVLLNGVSARVEDFPDVMGFVPQDDIVHADLTVRENLVYSGLFRLPRSTPMEGVEELAEETMALLEMGHVADSIVGDAEARGISGGQKKRVNIGFELMARPQILFLDEPTSGLDATSATVALQALKDLASLQGVTVITVIHQPRYSIYSMFDQVIVLARGGFSVYHGPPTQAIKYFDDLGYSLPVGENGADFLMDVSSGTLAPGGEEGTPLSKTEAQGRRRSNLVKAWTEYAASLETTDSAAPGSSSVWRWEDIEGKLPAHVVRIGLLMQFRYFLGRTLLQNRRAWRVVFINTSMMVASQYLACLACGAITPSTSWTSSCEFAMISSLLFNVLCTIASLRVFADNKLIFYREAGSGCSITAFFLSKCLFDTVKAFFFGLWSSFIVIELRGSLCVTTELVLMYMMLAWFSSGWAYVFALTLPRANLMVFSSLFVAICSTVLSGAMTFFNFESLYESVYVEAFVGLVSGGRWFAEWYLVSQYRALPAQYGYTSTVTDGFAALSLATHDLDNARTQSQDGWSFNATYLFVVGLAMRVLAFVLIHVLDRPQRNQPAVSELLAQALSSSSNQTPAPPPPKPSPPKEQENEQTV